jgi:prolyl-tRNA editing enzyme YbaK/EbsC (Cys-tRNA(Pro) deacylase)
MEYHPTVEKIKSVLTENSSWFETFEHEPVRTSEEASKVRTGYTLEQGAKAIIARVKEPGKGKKFVMFVMPAHRKFDSEKIKNNLGLNDVRFATEEEVAEITNGILPGGVPPFGNLFGLEVFVDQTLFNNEKIVFNAGDRRYSIGMRSEDYKKIVNPIVSDICQ